MRGISVAFLAASLAASLAACAVRAPERATDEAGQSASHRTVPEGATAPLFGDLGDHHYPVTTSAELAQRYFDQGLILSYGFNHAEAVRSFREASRIDPACAMCFWGEAFALGPNINKPMDDADVPAAWQALQEALALRDGVSRKERDFIDALAKRYVEEPIADRAALDEAFARAMREVARMHPDDLDAQTLFAESLMDTMPWDYYRADGEPKADAVEVVARLESVLVRDPEHPGATHYYIHAVEASAHPERAEAAADRLRHLVPGAGHLVHMPSHIYLRVGRYHDASVVNELAAQADESYISQCLAQGFYPALYYPHNIHFLWASAMYEGRSRLALETARKLVAFMPEDRVREYPFLEEFLPMYAFTLVRFGRWKQVLAEPAPPAGFHYATAMWHYARGMAYDALLKPEKAQAEFVYVESAAGRADMAKLALVSIGSTASDLLTIAAHVLRGEIAASARDFDRAVSELGRAVQLQDRLTYSEPPPWYYPVRDALGRALLGAGRPAEAEAVYRRQLEHTPRNGWSLFGLVKSLRAQRKEELAADVERQRAKAWSRADVNLAHAVF